jgi:thiamine transporter ThiT
MILDALGFILDLIGDSRFAQLGLLCFIAGVAILVTTFPRGFSYGIGLIALGIASAALGYWFTRGRMWR